MNWMQSNPIKPYVLGGVIGLVLAVAGTTEALAQQSISLTAQDCQWLVRHDPSGVAYQPGVDVHGRKVASADLPSSSQSGIGSDISFDLTPDLLSRYGIDIGFANLPNDAAFGKVQIKNGVVSINGKRVGMNQRQGLAAICRDKL